MATMKASTEKPKVSGSYWYRLNKDQPWEVVRVDDPFESTREPHVWFNQTDMECYPISKVQGEFAGPIQEPEEVDYATEAFKKMLKPEENEHESL